MKFSYFLRGLGVGIVFAAIILLIGNAGADKANLTDEEIISKAKQLGLVEAGKSDAEIDALFDESSADADKASDESTGESTKAEATTEETTTKEATTEEATTEEATTEDATTKEATTEAKKSDKKSKKKDVTFVINQGMYSEELAALLYYYGVIDDADKFNDYLCYNHGYSERLQPGTYTVKQGADYDKIARMVTN